MTGRIHSIQSLGTLDGPGVRFVAFLQGCPLRCGCCHNPDTWDASGGQTMSADELVQKAARYREYFGHDGGITLSGGEPLLQADFACEVFSLCHEQGIHTCLDSSGCMLTDSVRALLDVTDRVLLDIKYTTDEQYRSHVGCSLDAPLKFLSYLNEKGIPTTLRQVIIPSLNDTEQSILALRDIARAHKCVDGVELLPFRKICQVKYDQMGVSFPFGHLDEPSADRMGEMENLLKS
jgi:pyruvate formate lyase activating enzyme